jgi:hypothetical protein
MSGSAATGLALTTLSPTTSHDQQPEVYTTASPANHEPNNHVAYSRPGTREAELLLHTIARKHNTDAASLKDRCRLPHMVQAKREFCEILIRQMGKPPILAAQVLNLNHTTVLYHSSPEMRERKKQTRTRGAEHVVDPRASQG